MFLRFDLIVTYRSSGAEDDVFVCAIDISLLWSEDCGYPWCEFDLRIYSKVQKYVDSSSVNNDPTAAGEDCILASLERPSNYRLYYKGTRHNILCLPQIWGRMSPRKPKKVLCMVRPYTTHSSGAKTVIVLMMLSY